MVMASGRPLSPSQTVMQTSSTPRFLISVSTESQNFAPFAAVSGPQPEDVAFAVDADADRDVDRPVRDLPVTDLDVDRVDEHHRVDPVQGPVLPLGHLADDLLRDPRDGVLGDPGAEHLGEVGRDKDSGAGPAAAESAEMRELKKRNRLLEQENEILRRAAAYLARDINPK